MKVLITGAQGQVGKEIAYLANKYQYDVIAASRIDLDITNSKNLNNYIKNHKPDIVINAAAYTAVDKAEEEQALAYAINHNGAENLAATCLEQSIPLIHISTDYVFDGSKEEAYNEEDKVSPLGTYGMSKWQGEESIRKQMTQYLILRVAWVFGAQGNNFVKTMLRLGKEKDKLNVVTDQFGGPSPAKNIAEAIIKLVAQYEKDKKLQWGTYHYCGNPKTTWYDFAKEIFEQANEIGLLNKKIQVNPILTTQYPTPAKRPKNSMLDCVKFKNTFKIEMPDWREALKHVLTELK